MTEREKDEVVGRTHRELKEAKANAAVLKSDIDTYARKLKELVDGLQYFVSDPTGKGPSGMLKDDYLIHFHGGLLSYEIQDKLHAFATLSQRIKELEKLVSEF